MKAAFLVTSAIRTDLGSYDAATRLHQTFATIASIRQRVRGAQIALLELSATALDEEWIDQLSARVDWFVTLSHPLLDDMRGLSCSPRTIKSVTELACLHLFLGHAAQANLLADADRVFKLSGRYVLTEDFELAHFDAPGRYVFKHAHALQHSPRLWSFDSALLGDAHSRLGKMLADCTDALAGHAQVDIGVMLQRHVPADLKRTIAMLGLQGYPGSLGELIID
ncbi:hypothetical protein AX767_10260 [Variovorax sp. PAMC 28711]|nr:hypothetical protein AX767_10260 [Variovorax sp. PAMC 28711]